MMKFRLSETPPPGAGFKTVTEALPATATSPAEILAVNRLALTKLVVRAAPFHLTTDAATNPEPLTVSVNAGLPAAADAGERLSRTGSGFPAPVIVKTTPLETPPPGAGFKTVTVAVPGLATRLGEMTASNCVGLTYRVITPMSPFQRTEALFTKFSPFTMRVKPALPALTVDGVMLFTTGSGFEGMPPVRQGNGSVLIAFGGLSMSPTVRGSAGRQKYSK